MTIVEALRILELPIKSNISLREVKSTYRKLMHKYHPDINPEIDDHIAADLNEAYSIVSKSVETGELADILNKFTILEQYKRQYVAVPTIVVTVDQLCDIYAGKTLVLQALDGNTYNVSKANKSIFKMVIAFKLKIDTADTEDTRTEVLNFTYKQNDVYDSALEINVESLDDDYIAKISCAGTVMNLNMPKGVKRVRLRLKFDYHIVLDMTFTKKVRVSA